MKRGTTVCIDFPAVEDGLFLSVRTLTETLQSALSSCFQVVTPPGYIDALPKSKRTSVYTDLLRRSSVIITSSPLRWLKAREQFRIHCPCIFLPLGEGARGASKLRSAFSMLSGQDVIAFASTAEKDVFDVLVRSCAARAFMLPFFVDTDFFKPLTAVRRKAIRTSLGLTPDNVLVLYTGRITAEKNVHTLLVLLNMLAEQHPNVRLLVVGAPDDRFVFRMLGGTGIDMGAVFRSVLDLDLLTTRVAFTGQTISRDDLATLYGAADIFASLTLHHDENFGFSQVEAMSSGLPVVCTDWGGLKDTVTHRKTGFRLDTRMGREGPRIDLSAGFQYCSRLIRDVNLRQAMGAAGRERALEEYAIPVFRRRLESLVSFACERPASFKRRSNSLTPWGRRFDRTFRATRTTKSFTGGEPLVAKGAPISARYGRQHRHYYESLLTPFCSGRYRLDFSDDGVIFWPVLSYGFAKNSIVIEDPLFPGRYAISPNERTLLRFLDRRLIDGYSFTPVSEAREAGLMSPNVLRRCLRGLIAKGILMVS
jgi:glycosyltransferase involved in cell wall biosynthesis